MMRNTRRNRMKMNNAIELLESRRLLSGAVLNNHTLRITGDADVDDNIAVALNGTNFDVTINGGAAQSFAQADVKRIVISSKSGNDTVNVNTGNADFASVRVWISTDGGNDTVNTGN